MQHYDFIIAGGGAAGLSLACHLVRSPLRHRSILIVDKDAKQQDDRTWGFWTDQPHLFDDAVSHSWNELQFSGDGFAKTIDLHDYRYQVIRGIDFYRSVRQMLAAHANVTFLQGEVTRIEDGPGAALVTVDGQTVAGQWVFDSLPTLASFKAGQESQHCLNLYFKGWEIETAAEVFDPQTATLMDFRTPQSQDVRFFYVLPFSSQRALVEYTLFSPHRIRRAEHEQALRAYTETTLGIADYQILRQEGGCIPLTDQPFPRRLGQRIMAIGTKGGRIKPTTGYAFMRIQQDSAAIVRSLLQAGHPFDIPADSRFYRRLDAIMLAVMVHHGDQIKSIFTDLFRRNPIGRILRFLDETASPWDNLLLIASLPPRLFLQVLFQVQVLQRLRQQPA